MKYKKIISIISMMTVFSTCSTTLAYAENQNNAVISESAMMGGGPGGPGGNQGNFTHGSDEKVTEDMLVTEDSIPSDYDVNEDTQGKASKGKYSKLFDKTEIKDVNIDIDENNWNYMLQNAIDKPTVLTNSVTIGDETVKYAGIKTKGNLTLTSIWNSTSDRFSFTVNFGKYIKKKNGYSDTQNFYGLSKVAFNNIYGDSTLMKEYLSYELMTKMGVATPEYALVNLYVNGEFWGVYMMVESMESELTQRTFGEKSDYLVKPEQSGGDLIYDSSLDKYINEDGNFDFGEIEYPKNASNPLYKYNGLWENDEETFEDVKESLPTVFKWLKTLNELNSSENPNTEEYKDALEGIMNVDEVIRYFATNTYLVNLDSYQSEKMQNYGLYINEDGYMSILPWDYNFSFGTYGISSAENMINFDINNPVINVSLKDRPLLNVILQNDEYKALYKKYLKDCSIIATVGGTTSDGETYEINNFASIIDKYNSELVDNYSKDPTAFYTVEQYKKAAEVFKELINLRSTAVVKQLEGDTTKVESDINLRDLGDNVGGHGGMDRPGMQETTLKDEATKISVVGKFMNGMSLVVDKITDGEKYDLANKAIDSKGELLVYNIGLKLPESPMGGDGQNQRPADGQQPPMGGDGQNQPPADGQQPPMGGDRSNQFPTEEMKVYFPVNQNVSEVKAYLIKDDGTKVELTGEIKDESYEVTTNELGLFALLIDENKNDEEKDDNKDDNDLVEENNDFGNSEKTGDSNSVLGLSVVAGVALVGASMGVAKYRKKKENK